jgi:hypothetical protein
VAGVPLVLAEAGSLSRIEAHEVARRKTAGAPVLTFSGPGDEGAFGKALDALFPAERRAVMVIGPGHLVTAIRAHQKVVDIHIAAPWPERVSKARLRLPALVTRGARKGRFAMSDGTEVKLRFDRSGPAAVSVELPTFTGYAVLTPES